MKKIAIAFTDVQFTSIHDCIPAPEKTIVQRLEAIEDLVKIQCSNGNWNYDAYMHGLANGMILCQSIMRNEEPKFLDAPDQWLADRPKTSITASSVGYHQLLRKSIIKSLISMCSK